MKKTTRIILTCLATITILFVSIYFIGSIADYIDLVQQLKTIHETYGTSHDTTNTLLPFLFIWIICVACIAWSSLSILLIAKTKFDIVKQEISNKTIEKRTRKLIKLREKIKKLEDDK